MTLHRVGNKRLDLALLPNVGAEVGDRRPKFIDEKRPLIVLDVRRHYLRALAKEKLHCAAADPAGPPVIIATLPASLLMGAPPIVGVRRRVRGGALSVGFTGSMGRLPRGAPSYRQVEPAIWYRFAFAGDQS